MLPTLTDGIVTPRAVITIQGHAVVVDVTVVAVVDVSADVDVDVDVDVAGAGKTSADKD